MALSIGAMTLMPFSSSGLAIFCGCKKLKDALSADGNYSSEDALAVAECHGGFVIKICSPL
ncbi:MAG TPA: hypothetical protein DCE41_15235 [Cytophagales bacterium]|nr:hypothetical protein [Cytophagales bacterium]